jgi:chitodextrinase
VYEGTNLLANTAGTTYQATGLTEATAYSFTVKAKDAAGNASAASNSVSVTTVAPTLTPPVVTISAPADASIFTEGETITFTGTATDAEDGTISSSIAWSSNLDGSLGGGASLSVATLSVGIHTISASITDSNNTTRITTITVTVSVSNNDVANVTISVSVDGGNYMQGANITFTGSAIDTEDGDISSGISWSSSLDGSFGTGQGISVTALSAGTHIIRASITDSGNITGTAVLTLTVSPSTNTDPVVAIDASNIKSIVMQGASITFSGTATDAEDGDLSSAIAWSSSLDGSLGTGASLSVASLSVGTHTITASVTDIDNMTVTSTITVSVIKNASPTVSITAPTDSSSYAQGDEITFTGTASDTEDGDLSSAIAWSSNLDNNLGTGASLSLTSLSMGSHTITASITDSGNVAETITLTLTVSEAGTTVTGIDKVALTSSIEIYPNPVINEELVVKFVGEISSPKNIRIYDSVGKAQKQFNILDNPNSLVIPLNDFASGLIFVQFEFDDYKIVKRVIKGN